jgi:hypothetical protein
MKKQLLSLLSFIALSYGSIAQTTLINPNGDGGFENGSTLTANGWTAVNDFTNKWEVGTATFASGNNSAYISQDAGATNSYDNLDYQISHFYRDITFPANESKITLTFKLRGDGDQVGATFWDKMMVFVASTTLTPSNTAPFSPANTITGATRVYSQNGNFTPTYTTVTVTLPANLAGTTSRLIFTWNNDDIDGSYSILCG